MFKLLNSILLFSVVSTSATAGSIFTNHALNFVTKQNKALNVVNENQYQFTSYTEKQGLASNIILSMAVNTSGTSVYLGTEDKGIIVGNLVNNKWSFQDYYEPLVSNDVYATFVTDDNNKVIVGTPWGINVGVKTKSGWNWNQSYDTHDGIPGYIINAIAGTPDGKTIYLGTDKGIAVGTLLANGKYKWTAIRKGLPGSSVFSLYFNQKSNLLYVGTNNGLAIGKIQNNNITFTNYQKGLGSRFVYSVFASADQKYLIAGTHVTDSRFKDGGVSVGTLTTGGEYTFTNYAKKQPFSRMINVVTGTADASTLFIGSSLPLGIKSGFGLSIGTRASEKYSFQSSNQGLASPFVSAISPINNGKTIFVACAYGGFDIGQKID